jgi:tetratricopeptide (TPR) repeat protein
VITFLVQRTAGADASTTLLPLSRRLPNALLSWWRYVGKTVWPHDLCIFYPFPPTISVGVTVLAAVGLVALTVLLARRARAWPFLLVGWLWFAGMLVPVIGVVQVGAQADADRYTYLPAIGLVIALVWWVGDLVARQPALLRPVVAAALAALLALSIATVRQVATWKDTYTVFSHALSVTRDNATAESCLGYALFKAGKPAQAIPYFERTLVLSPNFPETRNWLGSSLGAMGRYKEGEAQFREELRLRGSAEAHSNLGLILERQGRVDEAIPEYAAAIKLDPDQVPALVHLGAALSAKGRMAEAEVDLQRAVTLGPADLETRRLLAETLVQEDRVEDAIREYEAIMNASPDDLDALNNVAWIRATHHDAGHRNGVEAVRLAERARERSPEPVAVLYSTLAAAYAEAGRFPDAVAAGTRAVDLARRANSSDEAERYAQQLEFYRAGRPFHFAR